MFNMSKEFNDFYINCTVLPNDIKDDLREKKKINLERLDSGLEEYNVENSKNYKVLFSKEQGSVAMSTITQNDSNDYDIDVAIIFDEENLEIETGSTKAKSIVVEALKKKCGNFKTEPTSHTNCVRIEYEEGYHVDFAIYKKVGDTYYHAGSNWQERNPMAITDWFIEAIKSKGEKLRSVVRLSKMFCKSRDSWKMPGGLIQSVLCEECFTDHERIDECFYYTMKEIADRLEKSADVYNPTDSTKSLLLKQSDKDKMNNWKNRLVEKLSKVEIITKPECTEQDAYNAWYEFFNHSFWEYDTKTYNNECTSAFIGSTVPDEEFIEDNYIIDLKYNAKIECVVSVKGFRPQPIFFLRRIKKWEPLKTSSNAIFAGANPHYIVAIFSKNRVFRGCQILTKA